ncbi:uncharacterized protein LOC133321567 [Musca vetustissima]|uniref:uncharacterized protein LOC133321567 n=1 Tax=Musca vetustissima TaxID=27455 RepID=UPI002AB69731|nr:uncharacterized protein LOC133321567 [Musca vetustissima]
MSPTLTNVTTTTATTPIGRAHIDNPNRRNKPQSNATAIGAFLFTSAGMNMAMGLGWTESAVYTWTKHYCYSWFMGVIIGAIFSMPLSQFMMAKKKWIMATAATMVLVDGILFISFPTDYKAILAARYLNGMAIGLITVPFLVHASEIAVDSFRGSCLMTEQYSLTFGIAIQMIYTSFWPSSVEFPANRLHGIFDIVFGVFAWVFLSYFIESPIDLIRKGDDMAALDCLARLQYPQIITARTHAQLEQQKYYFQEEKYRSWWKCVGRSVLPLVKMFFFRSALLAFSYNLPLNLTLRYSVLINEAIWSGTVAAICRIFGAFLAFIMVDHAARRIPSALAAIAIGILLILQAMWFENLLANSFDLKDLKIIMALYMLIQAFAGFFSCYTSVYLAEAFPLRTKPFFMTFSVVGEQLLQTIFILNIFRKLSNVILVQGVVALIAGVAFWFTMPETKNTTLSEAQEKFRKVFSFKRKESVSEA